MAATSMKSAASVLLLLNLLIYFVVIVIAGWAVNHAIVRSRETASVLTIPAHIFPIYFPVGNMATGFLVIFSLIAGIVGMTTSATGYLNITEGGILNLHAAAASSLITLLLTFLAMGLACKEIEIGWTGANLRTLEVLLIFVSATQLFCTSALHAGVSEVTADPSAYGIGRV
ncbi:membrane protein PM19L [Eucalyptus grandis]|nr:membrane protein PM19L [Eucalyptus grandis]